MRSLAHIAPAAANFFSQTFTITFRLFRVYVDVIRLKPFENSLFVRWRHSKNYNDHPKARYKQNKFPELVELSYFCHNFDLIIFHKKLTRTLTDSTSGCEYV